jgi:hypothetical protein
MHYQRTSQLKKTVPAILQTRYVVHMWSNRSIVHSRRVRCSRSVSTRSSVGMLVMKPRRRLVYLYLPCTYLAMLLLTSASSEHEVSNMEDEARAARALQFEHPCKTSRSDHDQRTTPDKSATTSHFTSTGKALERLEEQQCAAWTNCESIPSTHHLMNTGNMDGSHSTAKQNRMHRRP